MVRTSTSWKSKEILRPLNDLFAFFGFKPPDSVLAALGDTSNTKRTEEALVLMSQFCIIVADNELGRIADTFERNVLYRRIEVSHI